MQTSRPKALRFYFSKLVVGVGQDTRFPSGIPRAPCASCGKTTEYSPATKLASLGAARNLAAYKVLSSRETSFIPKSQRRLNLQKMLKVPLKIKNSPGIMSNNISGQSEEIKLLFKYLPCTENFICARLDLTEKALVLE